MLAAEKTLADTLFEHAEQCKNNEDQRRFFEAMQQLKARGSAMQATFRQELTKSFQAFESGNDEERQTNDGINAATLSLVQREQLEDELAVSVIISKANSRNSETLWKLNRRLAVLRGGKNVSDETNPFGPAMVCKAMQLAVTQLDVDNKSKILLYKQLGKILVISFSKELLALNELLIAKGILPNLRFSANKAPEPSSSTGSDDIEPAAAMQESAASVNHQRQMYSAIRALQSSHGPRSHTAGGVSLAGIATDGSGGADTFSALDYALALSAIQQSKAFLSAAALSRPLPINAVEEKLFGHLNKQSNKNGQHKMRQDDADTVDLVGMIFRYMLDDTNLHDSVKSLLSHLHTPYLKLALMDKSFLDNYQHSARVLLNTMAEVGGKWVKEDQDRNVLPKIRSTVENILKGFIDDTSLFDHLLEDFSRYRDNLEKRSRMVEKRNTESQQGLEKLELARERAADEIEARLAHSQISEKVADLLRKPWTDFLSFNLLRHGEQSLTWQSALKVVDGVIWSVCSGQGADSKEDLQRRQLDFEKTVSEGLATIGYDADASKSLLSSLKEAQEIACHDAIIKKVPADKALANTSAAEKTAAISQPVTVKARPKASKPQEPPLSPEEQGMVDKLKEIAFGTWFEFDREKAIAQLKLAWFSRVTSHYMFVDHAGVKQAVETQANLARGMCAGTIRIVKPGKKSFMERALEAVLGKLKLSY
jgi:hypothetical protein